MTFKDTFSLAFRTVRSNKLRTSITVTIIAFGIMALIGIITAITAMEQSLRESFSSMGANAFSIRYKESNIRFGGGPPRKEVEKKQKGQKEKIANLNKIITKEEAEHFKENFNFPSAQVSIYRRGPGNAECSFNNKKTNPVVTVWGGDENYLAVNGYTLQDGRNLNTLDVHSGRNVCMIGNNVATKLFGEHVEKAIDNIIRVNGIPYRIIGLLKSKGSSGLMRQDDIVITSYSSVEHLQNISNTFFIGVMAGSVNQVDVIVGEATAAFRSIRKLTPTDTDNFVIEKSDKAAEQLLSVLGGVTGSAGAIGLITLIGAAIGLMNIMLVAVNERTREVGLIKAIGGKKKNISQQFLLESLIISLLGALFGIILGVIIGNVAAGFLFHSPFAVPWLWVVLGIVISTGVGLLAGLYPAMKASKLSPIVALRYE